jgi:hypothetical protein
MQTKTPCSSRVHGGAEENLGPCKKQKLTHDAAPLLVWLGWAGDADIV